MLKNEHVFFNTTCFIAGAPRGALFFEFRRILIFANSFFIRHRRHSNVFFEDADKVGAIVESTFITSLRYVGALVKKILGEGYFFGLDIGLERRADMLAEIA